MSEQTPNPEYDPRALLDVLAYDARRLTQWPKGPVFEHHSHTGAVHYVGGKENYPEATSNALAYPTPGQPTYPEASYPDFAANAEEVSSDIAEAVTNVKATLYGPHGMDSLDARVRTAYTYARWSESYYRLNDGESVVINSVILRSAETYKDYEYFIIVRANQPTTDNQAEDGETYALEIIDGYPVGLWYSGNDGKNREVPELEEISGLAQALRSLS